MTSSSSSTSPRGDQNATSAGNPTNSQKDDAELQKFVTLFQESTSSSSSPTNGAEDKQKPWSPFSFLSRETTDNEDLYDSPHATNNDPLDPVSESILPVTMSCRSSFDLAFHCQSLGGQWTSLYRNGELRSCSTLWSDFWFCMRTRGYGNGSILKENAIRDHHRQRIKEKYYLPESRNSEEVWEPRTEKLPREQVFNQELDL